MPLISQRVPRERRSGGLANEIDDGCRQVAKTDHPRYNTRGPAAPRQQNQQRNIKLRVVKTLAMIEEVVLPQSFAVIGCNYNHGIV